MNLQTASPVLGIFSTILCSPFAHATSEVPESEAFLCEFSSRIVLGTLEGLQPDVKVRVSEWLKGSGPKVFRIESPPYAMSPPFRFDGTEEFLIFLHDTENSSAPVEIELRLPSEKPRFEKVLQMVSGPVSFIRNREIDPALAELLGGWFKGFTISCPEVPSLTQHIGGSAYVGFPWSEKNELLLRCRWNPNADPPLKVVEKDPPGPLADFFVRRLRIVSEWDAPRDAFVPAFSLRVDARVPESAHGVSRDEALDYLHACLNSEDSKTVNQALNSLSRMRDLTAVPAVIDLMNTDDSEIRRNAIEFLSKANDARAVEPLCNFRNRVSADYPETHSDSDTAAWALQHIGAKESIPALERAIRQGVQNAGYALGALADESSFPVILEAYLADPEPWSYCAALYRLVRRSNLPVEPWMEDPIYNVEIGNAKKPKWKVWWEKHQKEFRVERAFTEEFPQN